MKVLVDTSVWVDYFRGGNNSEHLDFLIEENLLVTNDLILAELIPFLRIQNQKKIMELLYNRHGRTGIWDPDSPTTNHESNVRHAYTFL